MITQELLNEYRDKTISFCEMAKRLNMSHQNLSLVFKKEGLLSNKKLNQASIHHTFFDNIDSLEKSYLLGYYIADGSIYESKSGNTVNKRVSFSCTVKDIEFLHMIKETLNISNKISISPNRYKVKGTDYLSQPMAKLQFTSSHIFDLFNSKGYGQNKTYLSYTCPVFMNNDLFFKFLLGVFDGDGGITISSVSKGKYNYTNYAFYITSNCKEFLESLKLNLEKFNIVCSISSDKTAFRLSIYKRKSILILRDLMYQGTGLGLSRKRDKLMGIPS